MSKTYTLAITKIIVVEVIGDSAADVCKTTDTALKSHLYLEQWQKAIAKIDLIAVE